MYNNSAYYYDALCKHKDYFAASEKLREIILKEMPHAKTLIDVACGTGGHIEYLKNRFQVEGLDLSPDMLAIAARKCPGIVFHQADLVGFNLNKKFDVVTCLFGSVGYSRDVCGLERALASMSAHLNEAGILIVEPWITPERFEVGKITFDWVDEPQLKVCRMYVSRLQESISVFDIEYLVANAEGVNRFSERHELGLFNLDQYISAFKKAGFAVSFYDSGMFGYGLYVGVLRR